MKRPKQLAEEAGMSLEEWLADTDSPAYKAERLILDTTELLIEAMQRAGVSQSDLAEKIGKSKGHVSQLLSGKRNMTLRTLAEIAHALGLKASVTLE